MKPTRLLSTLAMSSKQFGVVHKIPPSAVPSVSFDVHKIYTGPDGKFPNNELYPTIIYKDAFDGSENEGRRLIVESGKWTEPWVWGIFTFHHYHTKAWELLLCIRGSASIQIGGDSGPSVPVSRGDLMLIPPGVAHKQLSETGGFSLLGSYPKQNFDGRIDTCTKRPTDEEQARIEKCYVPEEDPIFMLEIQQLCNSNNAE